MDSYERLAAVIEAECERAAAGDLDGLAAAKRDREAIVASLPATPPPGARPALERCARAQERLRAELLTMREALIADLRRLRGAQRAADGYRPARRHVPAVRASA